MSVDHAELLRKYLRHVREWTDTTFLRLGDLAADGKVWGQFTPAEVSELRRLDPLWRR